MPLLRSVKVFGRNQTSAKAMGVHLCATLALTAGGLPLGVLHCAYRAEKGPHRPKTQRWVDGLHDIMEAAPRC